MVLLQWCQLTPQGSKNDLAAVIFTKPVQVSSLRIFPTGAKPFALCPDIVASTEPDAFFLDIFFNALPIQPTTTNSHDPQDKRKNVLVPTRIAYAGGQSEFSADMGPEYATRLIIFQGPFKQMSMAIYGDVVGEHTHASEYEPKALPIHLPIPLSSALDLANSDYPTVLAEQLLALMPSPAPLALLIRLMFCLKPEKEDWDNPHFPYVYSNFERTFGGDDIENEVFDLESLVQAVGKPLKEDVSAESLTEFVGKIKDLLGSDASDDAYFVAKILTKSACQQSLFPRILLQHIDLVEIFNEETLDETTVLCLAEAASSIVISRRFAEESSFMEVLNDLASKTHTTGKASKKLLSRVRGWQLFEDALCNPDGDFVASSLFLKDISSDEFALGCWLECMINQEELVSKMAANPIHSKSRPSLPILFQEEPPPTTHEEFIMFVRAFLGISTVLAMLAWSDSLGDDPCCERTLHVLVTWQGVNGYREILNHCLLLRQMARRLEWIKNDEDDQRPKKAGILVERLLAGLAKEPQAMLRSDVATALLALKPPFCHISTDEMLEIEKIARVAQDGLWSAFEEITYDSVRPFSSRRLRVLRVSIAVIVDELRHDNADWRVLKSFWNDRSQRLLSRLMSILSDISNDLNHQFKLDAAHRMNQALSEALFRTGSDFLRLIFHFSRSYPLSTRDLKTLTAAIADLYICSDGVLSLFSSSSVRDAATMLKELCLDVLSNFSNLSVKVDSGARAVTVIFPMLVEHASKSSGRDPIHHIFQLHLLVDNCLPRSPQYGPSGDFTFWATEVFAPMLQHLREFYRLLDLETRLLFFIRLITIEKGEIGLGEWLLEDDLKDLMMLVELISSVDCKAGHQLIVQGQLSAGIQFWRMLISSPETSDWVIERLASNSDLGVAFKSWLSLLLDARLASLPLTRLSRTLAICHDTLTPEVSFTVLLLLLRSAQQDTTMDGTLEYVPALLKRLTPDVIDVEFLRTEIGHLFAVYCEQALTLKEDTSEKLVDIMEWIISQEDIRLTTLTGVCVDDFHYLCTAISSLLSSNRQDELSSIRSRLTMDGDKLLPSSTTELQESISLSVQCINDLLSLKTVEPSTPKGTKTPDILGVIISPPTAMLRSPAATGLTKTYANNDFRQLRQIASTRLNTSRLPSTHVDEFQNPSAELLPAFDPLAFEGLAASL